MEKKMYKIIKLSPRIMSCCLVGFMSVQTIPHALAAHNVLANPAVYLMNAEDAAAQDENSVMEYHEISSLDEINDEGTYVIYYDATKHILYHTEKSQTTDQVTGTANGSKLELAANFDTETQTWKIIKRPDNTYEIKSCSGTDRYLNLDSANRPGDKVPVSATSQELTIEKVDDSFTIGRDNLYLAHTNKTTEQFYVSADPTPFKIYKQIEVSAAKTNLEAAIEKVQALERNHFTEESIHELEIQLENAIQANKDADESVMISCTQSLNQAMQALVPKEEFLAPTRPNPDTGVTEKEPFPRKINGNDAMRIPALTTLNNGWLAAAIDARWDNCPDGEAIDTLFSVSRDNGETWTYSFPNYFNDSTDLTNKYASAFLDPVMVQGKDDTLYLMVDVLPGGTQKITQCASDTGYRKIDDQQRLVLYTTESGQTTDNWSFYVGDFETAENEGKAYAPVLKKDADGEVAYWVDDHYYLYTADKKPMYCPQTGVEDGKPVTNNGKYVHQNVFFYNAALHVRKASYLWLITSTDNGSTWSAPTILNPQIRPEFPGNRVDQAYIVGPGAGLCLEDGTIMLSCYTFSGQYSSFIYKNPDEDVWHRSDNATTGADWSSESGLVQIDENTVRHFYRDSVAELRYTDHTRNSANEWKVIGEPVRLEGVVKATNNQLSALRYSQPINGKPVILVSTATVTMPRSAGRIYTFNVENDGKMTLLDTYNVDRVGPDPNQPDSYSYSSLTELQDGRIGLLYEDDARRKYEHAAYVTFTMEQLMPHHQNLYLKSGEQRIIEKSKGAISQDYNPEVIDVKAEPAFEITGGQGTIGASQESEALAYALYTAAVKDGNYQFAATAKDGTKIWANNVGGTAQIPAKTTPADWTITDIGDGNFNLNTTGGYLYFYNDGKNHFDRVSKVDNYAKECKFQLYQPAAAGEKSSEEVPGFVQVMRTDDIKDGGRYLIAAKRDSGLYVMRPSGKFADTEKLDHVLKVNANAENIATTLEHRVILTARSEGATQVKIDDTTYYVSVSNSSSGSYRSPVSASDKTTTVNRDGSVTVTETRPDGTVIETKKVDGTNAEIHTDANG